MRDIDEGDAIKLKLANLLKYERSDVDEIRFLAFRYLIGIGYVENVNFEGERKRDVLEQRSHL